MKPPPFEYFAPASLDEALALMAEHGWDAKPLAGGQSLIPMMNFRLAQPEVLVDLNPVGELAYIRPADDGGVLIGAMTRHKVVQFDELIAERAPLVHDAMPRIATHQVRNRGTFGGSLAHADPAAELVSISLTLNARLKLQSASGERWVAAEDFFLGLFTTALEPEEILTEIHLPPMPGRSGWSLQEVARRPHDFALMGVAAVVTLDEDGRCAAASLSYLSAGDRPMKGEHASQVLLGEKPSAELFRAAAEAGASQDIEPSDDIHASAEFRRHLANVLTRRALEEAFARAAA
ncbi:MAG: xanthine dehydrogenase family protein subunit M [Anaerolineae bacterium]|nr:MAG: xanthine dehydrogenase family protein subunit M [Anaerolineae bacterium]